MELKDPKEIYINHSKELIANILEIEEELLNLIKIKINIEIDILQKKNDQTNNHLINLKINEK
jgi:hypothetical protein